MMALRGNDGKSQLQSESKVKKMFAYGNKIHSILGGYQSGLTLNL
jgi:hypothetical protein